MSKNITEKLGLELSKAWLDHVAIAVENGGLEKAVEIYSLLGLKFSNHREIVEEQKVKTAFAPIDQRAHLELLESTDEQGPIGKFLSKKGPGVHHLCFGVPDLKEAMAFLLKKGVIFLYPEGKIGAGGKMVNFIHPKSTGGVLVELSQDLNAPN